MTITFKKLFESPDIYYELSLSDFEKSYGEFFMYDDNNPEKGTSSGTMIKLHSFYKSGPYRNSIGDVYVTPLFFASEFYPVVLPLKGKIEQLVDEAKQARIDKIYEDTVQNDLLDTVAKELGEGETDKRD